MHRPVFKRNPPLQKTPCVFKWWVRLQIDAVKKYKVSSGLYNSNSIKGVAKYYCDHEEEFEALRMELSKCGVEYPPMKLMDMCFWQSAYIEEIINKKA